MVNSYFSESSIDYGGPRSSEFLIGSCLPSCTDFRRAGPDVVTPLPPSLGLGLLTGQPGWEPWLPETAGNPLSAQLSRVGQPSGSRLRSSFSDSYLVMLNLLPTSYSDHHHRHHCHHHLHCPFLHHHHHRLHTIITVTQIESDTQL